MDTLPKLRLFVDAPLSAGIDVTLPPMQTHYVTHVMRADSGTPVAVFNGHDGEWVGRLERLGKRDSLLRIERLLRTQEPEPDLGLLFAPVKRARIDFIVEKATELGVSFLQPVWTRHTVMSRVNEERLMAIAIEAAEQCERLSVPVVRSPMTLENLLSAWPSERRLILLDEGGGGRPIAEVLVELPKGPGAVLVGPEGGFAKSELDALRSLSFAIPVGLGPRILRADTAVLAALACYQAVCGDGRMTPPPRQISES